MIKIVDFKTDPETFEPFQKELHELGAKHGAIGVCLFSVDNNTRLLPLFISPGYAAPLDVAALYDTAALELIRVAEAMRNFVESQSKASPAEEAPK